MKKNYNYQRKAMHLPEYGRHIHEMVDYLLTIDNRELRNRQARAVVAVMGNLNSILRDNVNYNHKLWDHLFIMSDFKLDVDSPYPIPTKQILAPVPKQLSYPRNNIRRKHYGRNIQEMIRALESVEDKAAVEQAIGNIAKFMRTKSFEYNQEHPDNGVIIRDIKNMSKNGIEVDEIALTNIKSDYRPRTFSTAKRSPAQSYPTKNSKIAPRGRKNFKPKPTK